MIKIVYILADGTRREVGADVGETLKDIALRHSLPGIAADCGGVCACATCHVIVSPEWFDVVGAPPEFEDELLMIADDRQMNSRLGCQVEVTIDMNGLEVRIP